MALRIRAIHIIPTSGEPPQLLVQFVTDDGAVISTLPGRSVAPLRAMLQRVEAEYPMLTGDDTGVKDGPVDRHTIVPPLDPGEPIH